MEKRINILKIIGTIVIIVIIVLLIFFLNKLKSGSVKSGADITTQSGNAVNLPTLDPVVTYITYSLDQVAKHNKADDCWIAINGIIVDVTKFIASGKHNLKIINGCGRDATADFVKVDKHFAPQAQDLFKEFVIGNLR